MSNRGKKIEQKPFKPSFSMEQLLAFDPEDPATFTDTPFVNAVMEAFFNVKPRTRETLGQYLDIPPVKLGHAFEVITGYSFSKVHEAWLHYQYEKLSKAHPTWSADEIAVHLGYSDGSAVWRLLHRSARKKRYAEWERPWYLRKK